MSKTYDKNDKDILEDIKFNMKIFVISLVMNNGLSAMVSKRAVTHAW